MNKWFFRVLIPVWVILLVVNFALPKKSFSESENRLLSKFPSFSVPTLLDGSYMHRMDEFVNDHFLARDQWITMQSCLEYGIGKREINGVFIGKNALMGNLTSPKKAATEGNTNGIEAFCRKNHMDKSHAYLMLVPSASAIQQEQLPALAPVWNQQQYIQDVTNSLDGTVTPVDVFRPLSEHKQDYIYYRTDHHWTSDGAFLAYTAFMNAKNETPKQLSDFTVRTVSDCFFGTLSSKCGMPGIAPDTMKKYEIGKITGYTVFDGKKTTEYPTCYFDEFLGKKDKYSYFLGQNQPVVSIKTNSTSNRRLLMFKDSYSHTFAPMLADDYKEITLIDLRYINQDIQQYVDVSHYQDVLFLYSTDVFSHQRLLVKLM